MDDKKKIDKKQVKVEKKQEDLKTKKYKLLDSYSFESGGLPVNVKIFDVGDYVYHYNISIPLIEQGTKIYLERRKGDLIASVDLDLNDILDPKKADEVKKIFNKAAVELIEKNFSGLGNEQKRILASYLVQSIFGLGDLEPFLHDEKLEEVVVNGASKGEYVQVYHKKYGWCKTNVHIKSEEQIYDYAAMIGRKIGKQINVLNPLMDAHLSSGDRVNATLFPISSFGNTITIRKFSKNPWTITNLIKSNTVSPEVMAMIWLSIQNEMSLLVAGGTGSGKTSFLNAIAGLIPANQRVISIEDTRELTLPVFLHWVPMTTREPNAEGKGEIKMIDLLVNSLRQRPDRIVVGEVRRKEEAEILFEAMHTGHSVYATFHADNTEQAFQRLTNPPIDIPKQMLGALAGVVVQFRHRRLNIRRTLEFAEIGHDSRPNVLYRWDPRSDKIMKINEMTTLAENINLYTGLTKREIYEDVEEKVNIIKWMVKKNYQSVDSVGRIVSSYYIDPEHVLALAKANKEFDFE